MALEALAEHAIDGTNIPKFGFDQATAQVVILLREACVPVDVLFVDLESGDYRTATESSDGDKPTRWAGRDNLADTVVRLHANLFEWLAAGCSGVCNLARVSRSHMADLKQAKSIVCSDIHTALQAWDWGAANKAELARFTVDGPTAWYFNDLAWCEVEQLI